MNRELILLWPEITLDIYLSAGGDLIFKLLRSKGRIWISCWKLFLYLASWVMTCIIKMYCSWCITILGYTCQIRKFGKFINIPSNTKFFRRSWITPLLRSSHQKCSKAVLKKSAIFTGKPKCWSLFLIKLQMSRCFPVNIAKSLREPNYFIFIIICQRLLLPLKVICKDFVDINYDNASFGVLEDSI